MTSSSSRLARFSGSIRYIGHPALCKQSHAQRTGCRLLPINRQERPDSRLLASRCIGRRNPYSVSLTSAANLHNVTENYHDSDRCMRKHKTRKDNVFAVLFWTLGDE